MSIHSIIAGYFNAIAEAFLSKYVADVILYCPYAYAKLGGYVFIAESASDRFGDSSFGFGQLFIIHVG
jgi:hypothetical protein